MNRSDVSGKVAVVTGSTKGIGRAGAEALAAAGAKVVISSRTQSECDNLAAQLNQQHGDGAAAAVAADISKPEDLRNLVDRARERFGKIDILVCNAASNFHAGPMITLESDAFLKTLNNNVVSSLSLVQLVVPDMMERREGAVVIISSIGGLVGAVPIGAYNASKAADIQMVRNLAVELGEYNIRVNALAPGLIRTDMSKMLYEDPAAEAEFKRHTPLGRLGQPEEMGSAILFLSSPASSYMTGQALVVDGGVVARGA